MEKTRADLLLERNGFTSRGRYVMEMRDVWNKTNLQHTSLHANTDDPEEHERLARAFLSTEWQISNGYTHGVEIFDRPWGWRYRLNVPGKQPAIRRRPYVDFKKVIPYIKERIECWRAEQRYLRNRHLNPYAFETDVV